MAGNKKKKPSLMQRISSWFEQLPLRRRSSQRRTENRRLQKQSKSAAPRLRYSVSAVHQSGYRDHSADGYTNTLIKQDDQLYDRIPDSWNRQETVARTCRDQVQPKFASLSQAYSSSYCSEPTRIRTNPWVTRRRPSINVITAPKPPTELYYASVDRCPSFRIKSLDESTCSSGYGSQDSSPESSVHSPDWQPSSKIGRRGRFEDKAVECNSIDVDEALGLDFEEDDEKEMEEPKPIGDSLPDDDEHIYHELEAFSRFSLLLNDNACSSDSDFSCSPSSSRHSRLCSPIYAEPYPLIKADQPDYADDFPNTAASFTYIPCANYRPAPKFHAPPPPPVYSDFDQAELDFLAELDAQIADLQVKSVAVRQLVDEARERRDARSRSNQLYMKELSELRQLKWVLQDHFELVL